MKKGLLYGASAAAVCVILYSIIWLILLFSISHNINNHYANQQINTKLVGTGEGYFVKFSKIAPTGFPFKIALKIVDWIEESEFSKIECKEPIVIGYDLVSNKAFISYSGEIIARYKPLQQGFGSKISAAYNSMSVKIPLSIKFIKQIWRGLTDSKSDLFEMVNFIKALEFQSKGVEIFDLVDNTKLYDQDYENIKLTFAKHKYYHNLEDFLQNIPLKVNIFYSTKVNHSTFNRQLAPVSLLYGIVWPFVYSGSGEVQLQTGASKFADIGKDLEIKLDHFDTTTAVHSSSSRLFYKTKIDKYNTNILFQTNSQIELKTGVIERIFDFLKYLIASLPANQAVDITALQLKNIVDIMTSQQAKLQKLENRTYDCDIDVNVTFNHQKEHLAAKINNFSIFSGDTGIRLTNEFEIVKKNKWNVNIGGIVLLHSYSKLVDFLVKGGFIFEKFDDCLANKCNQYSEVIKDFLRVISDHPDSSSNDLSFNYKISLDNIKNSKIGSTELGKLTALYYISLYKTVAANLKAGDNLTEKIKELAPNISTHPEILRQLIIEPSEINEEMWQKLIK